jgi:molybdate transport system ATP-binding protein
MLSVDIRKRYGDFQLGAAFAADGPQVTALFGRSGAGKSCLVRLLAGLDRPESGRIQLGERILVDMAHGIFLPAYQRRVGLVFQDSRLLPHYSVRGNLTFGLKRTPRAERFVDFDQVVALLGLGALLDRRPASLSGGEKQRVAIGRALLSSPQMLLMDEPLASLDGARKAELLPYIARLAEHFRLPVLYVSHDPEEILRIAGNMLLLEEGRMVAEGPVESVMSRPEFAAAAGRPSLITVIRATIGGHDEMNHTSRLVFAGGQITVPRLELPKGSAVRARIAADHVILARQKVEGLSVRNQLPGRVIALEPRGAMVDVLVDIGCPLHAELTLQACQDLALAPGMAVMALIKSSAIHGADVALSPAP